MSHQIKPRPLDPNASYATARTSWREECIGMNIAFARAMLRARHNGENPKNITLWAYRRHVADHTGAFRARADPVGADIERGALRG